MRARVAKKGGTPLPALARPPAHLSDSVRILDDQNDSDFLREDPLLKVVCGSLPESGADLASQPTICRMENAATGRSCRQIAEVLFERYLNEREHDGAA